MRNKLAILASIICTSIVFTACEKETFEEYPDSENNNESQESTNPEKEYPSLSILASIAEIQQSRANIVRQWGDGMQMGVVTKDKENLNFTYRAGEWTTGTRYNVTVAQTVKAFYPYQSLSENEKAMNEVVFDLTKQDDILHATASVTPDYPKAALQMDHKLALVRVKLLRDEYTGKGHIDGMTFENVPVKAVLDLNSGKITGDGGLGTYVVPQATSLDAGGDMTAEMVIPCNAGGHSFAFNLDGNRKTFAFHESHEWKPGMMYTYTLKLKGGFNCEVNVDDVPLDVDYWSTFGKTDDIVLREIAWDDFENSMYVKATFTMFGYDTYQNEGKVFGTYYYHMGDELFQGKLRFVLMQGNVIKEKFPPMDIERQGTWKGEKMACYVTATPGRYTLVPLFQRNGESTWFRAAGFDAGDERDYQVDVLPPAPKDLPSLRNIKLLSEDRNTNFLSYVIPYNKDFGVDFILTNRDGLPLKGEVKVTWEREFKYTSNCFRPCNLRSVTEEWNEEIGRMKISIPAGVKHWKGLVNCKVTQYKNAPRNKRGNIENGPIMHMYWRAEGTSEWTLLRLDAQPLFNRNYNGTDIWDETVNYMEIDLEEWYK